MPKSTFYRISAEKQKRILDASRKEFLSVPYSDVSINKIIKEAEIPRGSFYQYFDGKEDLFQFVLQEHKNHLHEILMREIEKYHGDVFTCIENNIDTTITSAYHDHTGNFKMLFSQPWVFETIWRAIMKDENCEEQLSQSIIDKIDSSNLKVENREELLVFIGILGVVVRDSICKVFFYGKSMDEETLKQAFHAKIDSLKKHYTVLERKAEKCRKD